MSKKVCIYIYIYTCVYVCIHICIHTYTYVHTYIYISLSTLERCWTNNVVERRWRRSRAGAGVFLEHCSLLLLRRALLLTAAAA